MNVLTVFLSSLALASAVSAPLDNQIKPVIGTGPAFEVFQGEPVSFDVTMDSSGSTPTTVNISSSNTSLMEMPSTQVLPANQSSMTVHNITAAPGHRVVRSTHAKGTVVAITFSCNGGTATAYVTVD
ncbi:hypothetical protein BH11ARM1_BH11ARM1_05620 [soil metagenome]